MSTAKFAFKRVKTKEFEKFYDVQERQARRKKEEMTEALGLEKGSPIYFPQFCQCVKRQEEEIQKLFGWS